VKFDPIAAVESCYEPAKDDAAWLEHIVQALVPLDQGPGLYAQTFHWAPDGAWVLEHSAVRGAVPIDALVDVKERNEVLPRELLRRIYAPGPCYLLDRVPELREVGGDILRKYGISEVLGIVTTEPDGASMLVALPLAAGRSHPPPRTVHQLSCLSAHLASSMRLRRSLRADGPDEQTERPDAVLDPQGRTLHAEGEAKERMGRESLAGAVRQMERARGSLRRSAPDEALRLWQGLVTGTWSLVDRCDSDGKRYLLARRNEPEMRHPTALTSRERAVLAFAAMGHQNKYIAYLLGVAGSTVSKCLQAAQKKLKVDSRSELIRRFAPLVPPQGHPTS
jgi:DNA-binding CsgD family transcriptional regulator